jgi:hypothetical protein
VRTFTERLKIRISPEQKEYLREKPDVSKFVRKLIAKEMKKECPEKVKTMY